MQVSAAVLFQQGLNCIFFNNTAHLVGIYFLRWPWYTASRLCYDIVTLNEVVCQHCRDDNAQRWRFLFFLVGRGQKYDPNAAISCAGNQFVRSETRQLKAQVALDHRGVCLAGKENMAPVFFPCCKLLVLLAIEQISWKIGLDTTQCKTQNSGP